MQVVYSFSDELMRWLRDNHVFVVKMGVVVDWEENKLRLVVEYEKVVMHRGELTKQFETKGFPINY
jgi:hypothetical protein